MKMFNLVEGKMEFNETESHGDSLFNDFLDNIPLLGEIFIESAFKYMFLGLNRDFWFERQSY